MEETLNVLEKYFTLYLKYLLTPAIVIGGFVYLIKSIFNNYIDRKFEAYKVELNNYSNSFQIKFSNLHLDRVSHIKELYHKIIEMENILNTAADYFQSVNRKEKGKKVSEFFNEYSEFEKLYTKYMIYFDESFCNNLKAFMETYWEHIKDINSGANLLLKAGTTFSDQDFDKAYEVFEKATINLNEKIPPIKKIIIEEIRKYLGVINSN